jgi:serine/threonine protein kinase
LIRWNDLPDASLIGTGNPGGDTTLIQQPGSDTETTLVRPDRRFQETDIGHIPEEDSWSSDDELSRIEQFATYDVIRPLGRGGMGIVLLAEDQLLHRKVALKIMRPELSSLPEFKERFYRERGRWRLSIVHT